MAAAYAACVCAPYTRSATSCVAVQLHATGSCGQARVDASVCAQLRGADSLRVCTELVLWSRRVSDEEPAARSAVASGLQKRILQPGIRRDTLRPRGKSGRCRGEKCEVMVIAILTTAPQGVSAGSAASSTVDGQSTPSGRWGSWRGAARGHRHARRCGPRSAAPGETPGCWCWHRPTSRCRPQTSRRWLSGCAPPAQRALCLKTHTRASVGKGWSRGPGRGEGSAATAFGAWPTGGHSPTTSAGPLPVPSTGTPDRSTFTAGTKRRVPRPRERALPRVGASLAA